MSSYKNKYILYLVLLNGILAALLFLGGKYIFEYTRSILGTGIAMAMFFIYEAFVIWFMESKGKSINARQSINVFLGFKAGKIIITLFFISIYAIVVKVELKRFVGVFILLYSIYLLFDTFYLITREKAMKKNFESKEIEKIINHCNENDKTLKK